METIEKSKLLEIMNTVLSNAKKANISALSPAMHLRNDIGFDSLDLAELTVRIEAECDVDIFEDGIVNTVAELMEKLNTK